MFLCVVSNKCCLRVCVEATGMFLLFVMQKQPRRGREHLVDLERSEQIYLVIRDHQMLKSISELET